MKFVLASLLFFSLSITAKAETPKDIYFIQNYVKVDEGTSTGGYPNIENAPEHLHNFGFKTVIDLRTEPEGTFQTSKQMQNAGLVYKNIPVNYKTAFEGDTLAQFTSIYESAEKPVLVFCRSGNRVGTLWAQYRIQQGVDASKALKEGDAMGMHPSMGRNVLAKLD